MLQLWLGGGECAETLVGKGVCVVKVVLERRECAESRVGRVCVLKLESGK